jgi:hypothetical protein
MVRKRLFFDIETSFNVGIFAGDQATILLSILEISFTKELLSASAINGSQMMMFSS